MTARLSRARTGPQSGIVIVEVLVGLILLAILIVPLARVMDSVAARAEAVRRGVALGAEIGESRRVASIWGWGPEVKTSTWRSGPVLDLGVGPQEGSPLVVGVWADGWFVGETMVDAAGRASVGLAGPRPLPGAELIIRARRIDETWGPPSRLLARDAMARPLTGDWARGGGGVAAPEYAAISLAHAPMLASPVFRLSWVDRAGVPASTEQPLILPDATAGRCEIGLGNQVQSWLGEVGRGLDVYF